MQEVCAFILYGTLERRRRCWWWRCRSVFTALTFLPNKPPILFFGFDFVCLLVCLGSFSFLSFLTPVHVPSGRSLHVARGAASSAVSFRVRHRFARCATRVNKKTHMQSVFVNILPLRPWTSETQLQWLFAQTSNWQLPLIKWSVSVL